MTSEQLKALEKLNSMAGCIIQYGAVRVKMLAAPTIRGERVFIAMEGIGAQGKYDIDRPVSEIGLILNKISLEVPKINANIETEIRVKKPNPMQKGISTATVWRTKTKAVYVVFSKELSEDRMVTANRFKIARDKSNTGIIYLIMDSGGDKPTKKTKSGRLGLPINPGIAEWFFHNEFEVDLVKIGERDTLRLTAI